MTGRCLSQERACQRSVKHQNSFVATFWKACSEGAQRELCVCQNLSTKGHISKATRPSLSSCEIELKHLCSAKKHFFRIEKNMPKGFPPDGDRHVLNSPDPKQLRDVESQCPLIFPTLVRPIFCPII